MPVNATIEYFKAEERYLNARTIEERISALEEMIRLLPKHKGTSNVLAQLNARMSKLKKEAVKKRKKGGRAAGVQKEGEAQVCLIGKTMTGKSLILRKITNAKPELATHPYTTTKPEVGMMNWFGVQIQIVELPSTMEHRFLSIAKTAELILIVASDEEGEEDIRKILKDNFIRTKTVTANPGEDEDKIKEKLWSALDMILVYTKKTNTPMALQKGSTVRDFCSRIHKDFLRNFRFAIVLRNVGSRKRRIKAGLHYKLQEGDAVEVYAK